MERILVLRMPRQGVEQQASGGSDLGGCQIDGNFDAILIGIYANAYERLKASSVWPGKPRFTGCLVKWGSL